MRTTVDVNDELLQAVKAYAAGERITLKAAFERALRGLLAGPAADADAPLIPVFGGQGVQPSVDLADSGALRDIMDAEPRRQRRRAFRPVRPPGDPRQA